MAARATPRAGGRRDGQGLAGRHPRPGRPGHRVRPPGHRGRAAAPAEHRVEHCGGPTPEQLGRIADLGVIPVNQPNFLTESGDELLATLGDRTHRLQPLRSELDRQILTVLSSDAFVSNYRPIRTIASAMGRQTESGTVIGADERLGFGDALRMHTLLAAEALGLDGVVGSITPGKYADLVHFTTDLSDLSPAELAATTPNATMIAGRWVTGAPPKP
ncbi:amidohydrolase family protein [Nonomuraea ferruginea]